MRVQTLLNKNSPRSSWKSRKKSLITDRIKVRKILFRNLKSFFSRMKRTLTMSSYLLQNDREHKPVQPWALICDTLLSRNLKAGTVFQLRQGTDISLLCEVHPLPHFSVSEEVIDHRTNRFLLRQNSETPV